MADRAIRYSEILPGSLINHGWEVRFDISPNGAVGISQRDGLNLWTDRVLLSTGQVKALMAFVLSAGTSTVVSPSPKRLRGAAKAGRKPITTTKHPRKRTR